MAGAIDPFTTLTVTIALAVILLSLASKLLRIPLLIIYILTGFALGPHGFNLIYNVELIKILGDVGVILLLFFIGMEINLRKLINNWKIALGGGILQTLISLGIVWVVGQFLGWSLSQSIVIAFVITISSTAVVLKVLESRGELKTKIGQNTLSILLFQDIMIVPMLLVINFLGGQEISQGEIIMQIVGAVLIVALLFWIIKKEKISIPFIKRFKHDEEIEIFLAFAACFGFAFLTGFFGLSTALGAFVAGILIAATEEKRWIEKYLHPFYIIFVALFFISIGLLIDLDFIMENWAGILGLLILTIVLNTVINSVVFKLLKVPTRESIYSGLILSQIGEFSFVLASAGFATGAITLVGYNYAVSVISLSLLVTPFLIVIGKKLLKISSEEPKILPAPSQGK